MIRLAAVSGGGAESPEVVGRSGKRMDSDAGGGGGGELVEERLQRRRSSNLSIRQAKAIFDSN